MNTYGHPTGTEAVKKFNEQSEKKFYKSNGDNLNEKSTNNF